MKLPVYFDHDYFSRNEKKKNGFSREFCEINYNGDDFPYDYIPFDNTKLLSVTEGYSGNFYFPIFWNYTWNSEYLKNKKYINDLIIPKFVLKSIEMQKAKLLIINVLEGNSFDFKENECVDILKIKFNIDESNIIFLTGNKFIHKKINSVYFNGWELLFNKYDKTHLYNRAISQIFSKQHRPYKFICLQRRPKPQRFALLSELYEYKSQGILTQGIGDDGWEMNVNYEREDHFDGMFYSSSKKFKKQNIIKQLPIYYDLDVSINNPVFEDNVQKFYDSYLHIVSETFFSNDPAQIFFSEKIFKPVIFMQPFVMFNQYSSLKEFKSMGFETFENYIDETYDNIKNDEERFYSAVGSVKQFIKQKDKTVYNLFKDLVPVLSHNFFNAKYRAETLQDQAINTLIEKMYY